MRYDALPERRKLLYIPHFEDEVPLASFRDGDMDIWCNFLLLGRGASGTYFSIRMGWVSYSLSRYQSDNSYHTAHTSLALLNHYNSLLFTV